jgi:hypothetical protein
VLLSRSADGTAAWKMAVWPTGAARRALGHMSKELEAYLDCGLLCRGFARPAKPQEPAKGDDEPAPKRKRGGYCAIDKPRGTAAPHVCDRCVRVPDLQGQNEARRHAHRAQEHRLLPHRSVNPKAFQRAHSTGGRRTGTAPSCAARRSTSGG